MYDVHCTAYRLQHTHYFVNFVRTVNLVQRTAYFVWRHTLFVVQQWHEIHWSPCYIVICNISHSLHLHILYHPLSLSLSPPNNLQANYRSLTVTISLTMHLDIPLSTTLLASHLLCIPIPDTYIYPHFNRNSN